VEEHRIKSAWEIAMEKVANMPGLTREEVARQKEEEYKPVGEAIARKYLEGAIRGNDLPGELGKYRGSHGQIVKQAFVLILCQAIDLTQVDKGRRAIEGIRALAGAGTRFEELITEFAEISVEFERETQQKIEAIEVKERERLRSLGISGSAIRPNVMSGADWQDKKKRIEHGYGLRLDRLRKSLRQITEVAQLANGG
jgi:hypothetical protein